MQDDQPPRLTNPSQFDILLRGRLGAHMQFDPLKRRKITKVDGAPAPSRSPAEGSPHRRELLQSLLAATLATASGWHNNAVSATGLLERDRFLELSEKLCAMSIQDRSLADNIQNALADQYTQEEFRRIAAVLDLADPQDIDRLIANSGLQKLAKSIVAVWYSGLVGTGERTRVLAYEEALAWRATRYSKAPGTCGEFGDWIAKPPTALGRESGR